LPYPTPPTATMTNAIFYTLLFMYLLFTVVALFYYLSGPAKKMPFQLNNEFLRGTWEHRNVDTQGQPWFIRYAFTDTDFVITAQPPLPIQGKYKMVNEIENLLALEFYHITSAQTDYRHPQHLQVSIDRRDNTLTIDNRTYHRVNTTQNS